MTVYKDAKKVTIQDETAYIEVSIDGIISSVPMSEDNKHYVEILEQVESGDLTIADAD